MFADEDNTNTNSSIGSVIIGFQSSEDSSNELNSLNSDDSLTELEEPEQQLSSNGIQQRSRNYCLPEETTQNKIALSHDVYCQQCCSNNCVLNFSPMEIWSLQRAFLEKNEVDQKQYLLNCWSDRSILGSTESTKSIAKRRKVEPQFVLQGRQLCYSSFCYLQGISTYKKRAAKRAYNSGHSSSIHGNSGRIAVRNKTTDCTAWLRFLLERIGDYMPHKNKVFIPPSYSYTSLYQRMVKEFSARHSETISYGHFLRIWHTELSEFVVGKVSSFTKCNICTSLKEDMHKANNQHERNAVQQLKDMHINLVEMSRKHYYSCRERARVDPFSENTIIIDGMDQSKTNIPNFLVEDKSTKGRSRLRTHLTGVLYHCDNPGGLKAYVFTDILNIPHDSNLTMNTLLWVILDNLEKKGDVLNVQMDNCYRENKNKFILALGILLVEKGVYKRVEFNFLPVGHTHEDVDQLFSRIAEKLRHANVYTLDELHKLVEGAYTPKIKVVHLHGPDQWDIKTWLVPHLRAVGNHSKPHHFLFQRVDGKTVMFYRMWSSDPWRPNDTEGPDTDLEIPAEEQLHGGLDIFKSIPSIQISPKPVVPSLEKLDPKLQQDICSIGKRLPGEALQWWSQFFGQLDKYTKPLDVSERGWLLEKLIISTQRTMPPPSPDLSHLEDIRNVIEQDCPEIIVGPTVKQKRQIICDQDYNSITVGMLVAVFVSEVPHHPQIGQVISIEDNWIKIHWYSGAWTSSWKPCFHGVGKNRSPVTEWLDQKSAILWDFALTNKNSALTKMLQLDLRKRYAECSSAVGHED